MSREAAAVAVIVPTLNAGAGWQEWICALQGQEFQPGRVLVIDSASDDHTAETAAAAGFEVRSIKRGDFDHGGTRQLAAALADPAEILIYLTQDALLANEQALGNILAAFDDPGVGIAYGRQLPRPGANPIEAHSRAFNYPPAGRIISKADISRLGIRAAFCSNSFAAYRRSALDSVGGFPSRVIFGEDTLVAARALDAGWKIAYCAKAEVWHSHRYSILNEFRRYFDLGVFHAREPWFLDHVGRAEGEGRKFVSSELSLLLRESPLLIPEAMLRNFIKLLGYRLGSHERHLPLGLKKRLGMNKSFWQKH